MGFLREQRAKWRLRHNSARFGEDALADLSEATLPYSGGPLGLTLQRSKSKWVDEIGPTKIAWHKDRKLGITFHERDADGAEVRAIAIKELAPDVAPNPALCVGQELIGVNGEPIAGLELDTVMDIIRRSESPCQLAFTPPPSPILVSEVSPSAACHGVAEGHVLVSIDGQSMLGSSLRQVSEAISAASEDSPVVLRFASVHVVFHGNEAYKAGARSSDGTKKTIRNTLCIAAVAAALTV